jgi:hypothetical protein
MTTQPISLQIVKPHALQKRAKGDILLYGS